MEVECKETPTSSVNAELAGRWKAFSMKMESLNGKATDREEAVRVVAWTANSKSALVEIQCDRSGYSAKSARGSKLPNGLRRKEESTRKAHLYA